MLATVLVILAVLAIGFIIYSIVLVVAIVKLWRESHDWNDREPFEINKL